MNKFGKLGLIIFGMVIGIASVEIGLRIASPVDNKYSSDLFIADMNGGALYKKNIDALVRSHETERDIRFATNSMGFVGRDYDIHKPEHVLRIAFLGDSFLAAQDTDTDRNFASLVERNWSSSSGMELEVLNFGVSGYGTMEEIRRFDEYVRQFDPDRVILFYYPNDLENNQYYLQFRRLITENDPAWRGIPFAEANMVAPRTDLKYRLLRSFRSIQVVDAIVRQNAFLEKIAIELGIHSAGIMGTPLDGIHPLLFSFQEPLPENQRVVYEFTGELMAFLGRLVADSGAELSVVYIPWPIQADPILWEETRRRIPGIENYNWDLDRQNRFLEETLARLHIGFFDLTEMFREHYRTNPEVLLYNNREGHLTDNGHALVGKLLLRFIADLSALQ